MKGGPALTAVGVALIALTGCTENPQPVDTEWSSKPLTTEETHTLERNKRERDYRYRIGSVPYANREFERAGLSDDQLIRTGWIVCYRMNMQDVSWREASQGVADSLGISWEAGHNIVTRAGEWLCPEGAVVYIPPKLLDELETEAAEGSGA